jgi:hypothetical protein
VERDKKVAETAAEVPARTLYTARHHLRSAQPKFPKETLHDVPRYNDLERFFQPINLRVKESLRFALVAVPLKSEAGLFLLGDENVQDNQHKLVEQEAGWIDGTRSAL